MYEAGEDMKANAESSTRVHLVRAKTGGLEEGLSVEELEAKVKELEEMHLGRPFQACNA